MTSDRELEEKTAMVSPCDLKQVKDAVSELRAGSPESALADLVEEKIRAMETTCPGPHPDGSPARNRRILNEAEPGAAAGAFICGGFEGVRHSAPAR